MCHVTNIPEHHDELIVYILPAPHTVRVSASWQHPVVSLQLHWLEKSAFEH